MILVLFFNACSRKEKTEPQNEKTTVAENDISIINDVKSEDEKSSNVEEIQTDVQEEDEVSSEGDYTPFLRPYKKYDFWGTNALSTVNEDNVSVRIKPDMSSEIIETLNKGNVVEIRGYSTFKETLDGYEGYWLKVTVKKMKEGYYTGDTKPYGWVFSRYVDVDPDVEVSTLRVKTFNEDTEDYWKKMILEIDRNGEKSESMVYPSKMADQDFYTFVWSDDMGDFFYSDPAGTFMWNPETDEIKNISDMGSEVESSWCRVSDDFHFLFQDFGTSPGTRGIGVYEIPTNKIIIEGSYYRTLDYDGTSITIVKVYNWANVEYKYIDDQSIKYAESFMEETPMSEEDIAWGGSIDVIVKYRFNLLTQEAEFIGCEYIHVQ